MTTSLPTRPVPYPRFDGTQPCLEIGPDAFLPSGSHHEDVAYVKQICAGCPFLEECREWAISNAVLGVWGGTSYAERRKIRRQLGISPIPITMNDVDFIRERLAEVDDGVTNAEVIGAQVGCSSKTVQRYRLEKQGVAA